MCHPSKRHLDQPHMPTSRTFYLLRLRIDSSDVVPSIIVPCMVPWIYMSQFPNGISIASAVFAGSPFYLNLQSLMLFSGPDNPQNCPFSWGSQAYLIHGSLDPPTQTACRSVQPFLQTHRQTDHATPSVEIVRILCTECMRFGLKVSDAKTI